MPELPVSRINHIFGLFDKTSGDLGTFVRIVSLLSALLLLLPVNMYFFVNLFLKSLKLRSGVQALRK